MSHAAVYGEVLFWFVVVLTLLLAMFIGVVIRTPSGTVGSPPPELTPPAPPPPMLVRWPEDAGLAGAAVQSARTGYQPRHAGGLKPELVVAGRLPASGCPPWGPAPKPPGPGLPHARSASCAANMTGPGPARRRSASIAVASTRQAARPGPIAGHAATALTEPASAPARRVDPMAGQAGIALPSGTVA